MHMKWEIPRSTLSNHPKNTAQQHQFNQIHSKIQLKQSSPRQLPTNDCAQHPYDYYYQISSIFLYQLSSNNTFIILITLSYNILYQQYVRSTEEDCHKHRLDYNIGYRQRVWKMLDSQQQLGQVEEEYIQYNLSMGKVKNPKYSNNVEIKFILMKANQQCDQELFEIELDNGLLTFAKLQEKFHEFLDNHNINYEAYMFHPKIYEGETQDDHEMDIIDSSFSITIQNIIKLGGSKRMLIIVQSYAAYLKTYFQLQMSDLKNKLVTLQQQIKQININKCNDMLTLVKHSTFGNDFCPMVLSPMESVCQWSQIDICVLFSQPIYNDRTDGPATPPVDFRSEIQRLKVALKDSHKPIISLKCEICTKENLKTCISQMRPKILHIICHGSQDGSLQLEDDSKVDIGALRIMQPGQIRQILQQLSENLPQLVFINSCHSQTVGEIFKQMGAKHVVIINSTDKIDDKAAQIFSENFYRNIFKGQKIQNAFKSAKSAVQLKANTASCCCELQSHGQMQPHKADCRWQQIKKSPDAHQLYHVPSSNCDCKNLISNRHKNTCGWARQSLFEINNMYRRQQQDGTFRFVNPNPNNQLCICCCYCIDPNSQRKAPHNESVKFKLLSDSGAETSLYHIGKNNQRKPEILDETIPQLQNNCAAQSLNQCVKWRQKQLFNFMKQLCKENILLYAVKGQEGVGRTSFARKAASYLVQRKIYDEYFEVDFYGIRDLDMFGSIFSQNTAFSYPISANDAKLVQIKKKMVIIIFDNFDQLYSACKEKLLKFMREFRNFAPKTKFIITLGDTVDFKLQNLGYYVFELLPLRESEASRLLFQKIRKYLDVSLSIQSLFKLVKEKPALKNPKTINNFSRSLTLNRKTSDNKLKINDLQRLVTEFGLNGSNNLLQQKLLNLKQRSQASYKLLIFISQFWKGMQQKDLDIFYTFNADQKHKNSIFNIPVDQNWRSHLETLLQGYPQATISQDSIDQLHLTKKTFSLTLQTIASNQSDDKQRKTYKNDYLQKQGTRYTVQKSLRDYIWCKHQSQYNCEIKHMYIGYMAVMLEVYFQWLVDNYHIHEQFLQYSPISKSGFFSHEDNSLLNRQRSINQSNIQSTQFNREVTKLINSHPTLQNKIKNTNPGQFIQSNILDFLNIYSLNWEKQTLSYNQRKRKTLWIYLQKLAVLIPAAIKIANNNRKMVNSMQSALDKSESLINQVSKFANRLRCLIVRIKIHLMRITDTRILKNDTDIDILSQLQKDNPIFSKMNETSAQQTQILKQQYKQQMAYISLYRYWLQLNNKRKITQPAKMNDIINELANKDNVEYQVYHCRKLFIKRRFVIALIFQQWLKDNQYRQKKRLVFQKNFYDPEKIYQSVIQFAEYGAHFFQKQGLIKLCLHAKITSLKIRCEAPTKKASMQQSHIYNQRQNTELQLLKQCIEIYQDKKYNLNYFLEFEQAIKDLKKKIKITRNNVAFFKSAPLIQDYSTPMLDNILRKKNELKIEVQKVLEKCDIDLTLKFEVLSRKKLVDVMREGVSILVIKANVIVQKDPKSNSNKVYLIFQGDLLQPNQVQINQHFISQFSFAKVNMFILIGQNAQFMIQKLKSLLPNTQKPNMISINNSKLIWQRKSISNNIKQLADLSLLNTSIFTTILQVALEHRDTILNMNIIDQKIRQCISWMDQQTRFRTHDNHRIIFTNDKGIFKDQSSGYLKKYNIDFNDVSRNIIYRQWSQIVSVFRRFTKNDMLKMVNIYGPSEAGKSTLLEQLARLFIERGMYRNGVYIIKGKQVEQSYKGEIQSYIYKSKMSSYGLYNYFHQQGQLKSYLLLIDDYHLIRLNRKNQQFLERILKKKVDLIVATHEPFNKLAQQSRSNEIFKEICQIRLTQKCSQDELDIFAYNVLGIDEPKLIVEYQSSKKKINTIAKIIEFKNGITSDAILQEQQPLRHKNSLYSMEKFGKLGKFVTHVSFDR